MVFFFGALEFTCDQSRQAALSGMVGKLTTHLKTGSCQRFHANKIEIYIHLHLYIIYRPHKIAA